MTNELRPTAASREVFDSSPRIAIGKMLDVLVRKPGMTEGRMRDIVIRGFGQGPGRIDPLRVWGIPVEEAQEIASSQISEIYPRCEHGVLEGRCRECPKPLNESQIQLLELLDQGMSTDDIAEEMFLSPATVRVKVQRLARRLGGERHVKWHELPALARERHAGSPSTS